MSSVGTMMDGISLSDYRSDGTQDLALQPHGGPSSLYDAHCCMPFVYCLFFRIAEISHGRDYVIVLDKLACNASSNDGLITTCVVPKQSGNDTKYSIQILSIHIKCAAQKFKDKINIEECPWLERETEEVHL